MKTWFPVIRAIALFAAILVAIAYITKPSGTIPTWMVDGKEISFPYSFKVDKPTWMEIETTLEGRGEEFLVLPRMGLSNIEVFLNGEEIWKAGDEDHHSRMWTHTFIVPLDLSDGKNTVTVKSYVLYDVKINWPPYLSSSPWIKVFLSNLFFSEFPAMFFGMAVVLGVLMMRISSQTPDPRGNIVFGISMMIIGLFMLDYSYIELFVSSSVFLLMRRVYYSLPYLAVMSYFYSMKRVVIKRKLPKKAVIPLVAISALPMIIPDFKSARMSAFVLAPFMAVFVFDVLFDIIRIKRREFISSFTFLALSTTYSAFATIWKFPNPGILVFGVACSMFVVIEHLYSEYKNLTTTVLLAREKSLIDPLTGAFNRRVFNEIPSNLSGSFVFIDLDGFKAFNDTYGHERGDEVLKSFANIVMNRLRKDDIFIRYGGDEFVVILNGCDSDKAVEIMEEIKRNFEDSVGLSFSYGISKFNGNLVESIKIADRKMYEMKRKPDRRRWYGE